MMKPVAMSTGFFMEWSSFVQVLRTLAYTQSLDNIFFSNSFIG